MTRARKNTPVDTTASKAVADFYRQQQADVKRVVAAIERDAADKRRDGLVSLAILGAGVGAAYYRSQRKARGR